MRRGKTRAMAALVVGALAVGAFAAGPAEAKKKKKPKPCPAFVPWADAADATTLKVTPKHTEAAPLEATLSGGPGIGLLSTSDPAGSETDALNDHQYQNIQADPTAKTTKLFVVIEFASTSDIDLFLRDGVGTAVFYAAGFNPFPNENIGDGTGNGGHSEVGAEWIDGPIVLDCTGFSLDIVSTISGGGDITVKAWLAK